MDLQTNIFSQEPICQSLTIDSLLENQAEKLNLFQQPKCFYSLIANHATELLDIALNDKDILKSINSKKSRTALFLLSNSPKKVMDELLLEGRFLIKSTIILGQLCNNSSYYLAKELAGRVSLIFINIITKTNNKDIIIDSVGFLTQMIPFIENDSVFDFFRLAASINDDFKEMQLFLSQVNLYDFLIKEMPDDIESHFEKGRNIIIFINDCLKNPILRSSFQREEVFQKLYQILEKNKTDFLASKTQPKFGDDKINLINEIYESLTYLVCKKLINKTDPLFTFSIDIIKKLTNSIESLPNASNQNIDFYSHTIIRKYHVCVFDLISKMIIFKSKMINNENQEVLIKSIERIIHVFPNHTNLIISAFRVVKASMHLTEFAKKMVNSLMSLLISLAKSKSRTAASAAATHFLADMDNTKKSSRMINDFLTKSDEFMLFYNKSFKNYLINAFTPYGGPVHKIENIEMIKAKSGEITDGSKNSFVT